MASASDHRVGAPADWDEFRRQMPVARRWAYFDHAAVAPLSGPAQETLVAWSSDATQNGDTNCPTWTRQVELLHGLAAGMIHAQPEEIALAGNTTAGINLVAEGFPWRPGDNVVTRADEFPTNQYPWMNLAALGVETRRVPTEGGKLDLDRLPADCGSVRTRTITATTSIGSSTRLHEQTGRSCFSITMGTMHDDATFAADRRLPGLVRPHHAWASERHGAGEPAL